MWPSTQRIGKVIRASSYFSTRRVVDLVPEACSTAMTEDRHDELAASNRPQHDRSRSDTVMISMNFNSYARLYFSSFLFFFYFVFELETLYTIQVLAVFDFYHRT